MLKFHSTLIALVALTAFGLLGHSSSATAAEAAHDEHIEGPHHGQLVELGEEEYHAELVHDDEAGKLSIYLLDSKAKNATPIPAELITLNLVVNGKPQQFKLPAVPQVGDPTGQTSRFELADKKLSEAMDAEGTKGRFNVTINGKQYVGSIKHHEHDENEHHK